ncbi:hypothetical protein M9H77_23882 [Catharanthus roseus]|uniref:Uncharacterized protein n=1 Tax=Catharanthus roseus TaxID=4058 RepID=A0ACC0AWQ0_CATRO|nr:hypothetical protein M9H77_23882 [Catharanthus roseus]
MEMFSFEFDSFEISCARLGPKGVKHLRREEEAILEQSNRRNLGGYPMRNNQWDMVTFLLMLDLKHKSYDCYESNKVRARDCYYDISCKGVPRNDVINGGGNYVNKDERFHKRRDDFGEYYDSYCYGGYNYARSSQALGTTSRPIIYKFKLPLLYGTFGPYDYEACKQKVESLFYS